MDRADAPRASSRSRDFWQLHVPLVLVLILCTVITVIEVRRASEGVWRAWAYMFEWPMIGLFSIWIWNRYRTQGSVTRGLADRWRERVERITAESDAARADAASPAAAAPAPPDDPGLEAWQAYVDDLQRRDPPGRPPPD
jgi:hypothetical protein